MIVQNKNIILKCIANNKAKLAVPILFQWIKNKNKKLKSD